jgi:Rrf2 family protein
MLTSKAKYALHALQMLAQARRDQPVLIEDLARQGSIPRKFLEQILLDLKSLGILQSKRGRGGGYYLALPPEKISLGQVIRSVSGPIALVPCLSRTAYRRCTECRDEATCGIRIVLKDVYDASIKILERTSLAEMVRRHDEVSTQRGDTPMYYI